MDDGDVEWDDASEAEQDENEQDEIDEPERDEVDDELEDEADDVENDDDDEDDDDVNEDDDDENEGEDGEIDLGPLKLSGWVSHSSADARLDQYDPWAEGIPFLGPIPSAEVVSRLDLREQADHDRTLWQTSHGGMIRTELWARIDGSGRREEVIPGERLAANAQFIRELLDAYPERTLIS